MTDQERETLDAMYVELFMELKDRKAVFKELAIDTRKGNLIHKRCIPKIQEALDIEMSEVAIAALDTLKGSLYEDGSTPKGEVRLAAAKDVLDRAGVTKKVRPEELEAMVNPIVLLPAIDS